MSHQPLHGRLAANLAAVRGRIARSCRVAGRDPGEVRLVAVVKSASLEAARALLALGVRDLAENRVQQLVERAAALGTDFDGRLDAFPAGDGPPVWHMIGHLQRNKVRALLGCCRLVHSLDSERLALELAARAARSGVTVDVLVEVNVAAEESKSGVALADAPALVECASRTEGLRLCGLMTMAPLDPDPQRARPHFARLRELLVELRRSGAAGESCRELSMGMSGDYAVAVEEGATIVRIGTALFEGLTPGPAGPAPRA